MINTKIYPDAIFIGAINYDYIFQGNNGNSKFSVFQGLENGDEILRWDRSNGSFDTKIQEMYENYDFKSKQIGGSAYLALRAFKAFDNNLNAAYVGVCGKPSQLDMDRGINFNEKDFEMIDNKEWFFNFYNTGKNDNYVVGRTCVLLDKNSTRGNIVIDPCVNDKLLELIKEKEEGKEAFENFLSKSRWIHITSFSDFNIFLNLIDYIKKAKIINPFLKISCDLGSEYTKYKRNELIKNRVFEVFDFIFLSGKELDNLMVNPRNSKLNLNKNMKILFQSCRGTNQQILVTKYENKYELYNKIDEHINKKTFWQERLASQDIINDTGAGDFFAGGFIGGMLSDRLLSHQPTPIEIGSIVAKERLKVNSINEACYKANIATTEFIKKLFMDEELNCGQLIKLRWNQIKNAWIFSVIVSFILGIITSAIM